MHITALLTTLSLVCSALAIPKHEDSASASNGTSTSPHHQNSLAHTCNEMDKLTKLSEFASNKTAMDAFATKKNLNATEMSDLMAKASDASTKLKTLESNSTLMSSCAVVNAHENLVSDCKEMDRLQKLQKLASNTTALDDLASKKNLNASEVQDFKDKVANGTAKLQGLMSNSTLMSSCSELKANESSNKGSSSTSSGASSSSTSAAVRLASISGTLWSSVALLGLAVYVIL